MTDIDCNSEMANFHREKVMLTNAQQTHMRERRDAGRTRLKNGLDLNQYSHPEDMESQGSYQMRTMVQDDNNDYDIDDGLYFKDSALTDQDGKSLSPLAVRERICEALKWDGRFKKEASVKNNCVRQDYSLGYHIDMPVYRIINTKNEDDEYIKYFELASRDEWIKSDARAVTKWFNGKVGELNRGESDGSQMRRVTKLTKKFARREDWKEETTSGICITKLIVDHFVFATDRDDKALRDTWIAIKTKLDESTVIEHPVLDGIQLASEDEKTICFFRDCLNENLKILQELDNDSCTREKAREVWNEVFNTTYFTNQPKNEDANKSSAASLVVTSIETARRNDGGGRFG
ncbi:MAG: hypothetical protein PSV24_11125 [Rhodoferax sp.]|nr:hypothetical protein [Rhodoferax sp.]